MGNPGNLPPIPPNARPREGAGKGPPFGVGTGIQHPGEASQLKPRNRVSASDLAARTAKPRNRNARKEGNTPRTGVRQPKERQPGKKRPELLQESAVARAGLAHEHGRRGLTMNSSQMSCRRRGFSYIGDGRNSSHWCDERKCAYGPSFVQKEKKSAAHSRGKPPT